jgi:hypothetical protein
MDREAMASSAACNSVEHFLGQGIELARPIQRQRRTPSRSSRSSSGAMVSGAFILVSSGSP